MEVASQCLKSSPHKSESHQQSLYIFTSFLPHFTGNGIPRLYQDISFFLFFLFSGERRLRGQPVCGYGRNPSIRMSVCFCPSKSSAFQPSDLYGVHCPLWLPLQPSAQATAEPSQQVAVLKPVVGLNFFFYFSLCLQYLMCCCSCTSTFVIMLL